VLLRSLLPWGLAVVMCGVVVCVGVRCEMDRRGRV
jgi:hypothetical protein